MSSPYSARSPRGSCASIFGLAAFASLLYACDSGRDSGGPGGDARFERIEFRAEATPSRELSTLATLAPNSAESEWSAIAEARSGVREILGRPCFIVDGRFSAKTVVVPVPEGAREFNRLVVEMAASGFANFERVEVGPFRGDEPLLPMQVVEIECGEAPKPFPLSFPRLAILPEPPDELRLVFAGQAEHAIVASIRLAKDPIHSDLALVEGDASEWPMGLAGGVFRRVVHVTTEYPTAARARIGKGDGLRMFVAADPTFVRSGETLVFECTVEVGGQVSQKRAEVEADEWERIEWAPGVLPTGDARVSVTLRSNINRGEAVGMIGEPSVRKPSSGGQTVLLITSDTHRADHVSVMNDRSLVRTPHLDELARTGVLFKDCYAQTNVTNPSHIGLMTAIHPKDTGILNNRVRLARAAETLAERFAAAGYETYATTSAFHLLDNHSGLGQGFDRMEGPLVDQRDGEIAIDTIVEWIDDSNGAPVFAWLHLFDAHDPYGPPAPYDRRYYDKERDPFSGPEPDIDPKIIPPHLTGLKDLDYPYAQYRAEVDYLDGALCDLLEHPRMADGVIAFTADHGESFGQHGIWWDHGGLYPDSIHIPLIMRWPGCEPGTVVTSAVRQSDVGPTLLAIAGVDPAGIEGTDLRDVVSGAERIDARYMISSHFFTAAVQVGDWLLILELRPHFERALERMRRTGEVELYNVAKDPACLSNLVLEEFELAKEIRAKLIVWLSTAEATSLSQAQQRTGKDEAMLQGLGYAGDSMSSSTVWWDPQRWCQGGWKNSPWNHLFSDEGYPREEFPQRLEAFVAGLKRR